MLFRELRRLCVEKLTECAVERPFYEADLIAAKCLGVDKNMLITKYDDEISPHVCAEIFSMVELRCERKPLSYILGEAEFYGRVFEVGSGVLIPRPETELLVEAILRIAPDARYFADWCTGSGCIGVTLLLENHGLKGVGVDASPDALRYAAANVKKYGLDTRFELIQNSDPAQLVFDTQFDFIAANPPYIASCEMDGLMRDVRDYEPAMALDGGDEGLDLYKCFFEIFPAMIKEGGFCAFETGGTMQAERLLELAPPMFVPFEKIYDYSGALRHLIWQKR